MASQVSALGPSPFQKASHLRDFSIEIGPSSLVIPANGNGVATVTVSSIGQFSGTITLTATISPVTNSPPSLSVIPSTIRIKSGQSINSTLAITPSRQTSLINFTVTVLAQASKISHSSQINVFIVPPPDFTLTLQPSSETVGLGTNRSSSYTLSSFFGFSGTITITPSNIPAGVGVGIQTPPPLAPGAKFTGGLFINVDTTATSGNYSITFTAQSGSLVNTAILSLTISSAPPPDFSLTAGPSFLSLSQGSTGLVFVSLSSISGFNGTISLTSGVIPMLAGGPTTILNMSSVNLGPGSSRAVELRIITTATTTTGFYNYTVTATSGSLTHTAVGSFAVTSRSPPDFSISATPSSLTISQGSSNRIFLNLTSLNGFSGTINLNATVSPTGPRIVLGANSVTLNGGGTTEVVLAIFANTTIPTPPGNYLIAARGFSGNLTRFVDIQLSVTSSTASLVLVSSVFQPTNVTLQLHNQGGASISLSSYEVSDSSNNNWTRAGWPGPTINPSATSLAVILIGASCPSCTYHGVAGAFNQFTPGHTYTIIVTGQGQAFLFTLTFSTATEALSLEGSSFFSATNVTLFLRNTGNVSVSLVTYYVKDSSGNQYALTAWAGPTITSNQLGAPQILIGSSCPSCTLTGTPFTFTPGMTYTITIVTSRNNQFTFTVTR